MRDRRAAGIVSAFVEDSADDITVEVRLGDEALARWISDWIAGNAAFTSGAAHGPRSVLIADHVPDDVDTAIVLLGGDDVAGSTRNAQVLARLTAPVNFVKLRIAVEAAAHGLSVFEPSARFGPADDGAPDLHLPRNRGAAPPRGGRFKQDHCSRTWHLRPHGQISRRFDPGKTRRHKPNRGRHDRDQAWATYSLNAPLD
jgi:hypothetical protein